MEITDVTVHTVSLSEVASEKADGTQDAAIVEVETDAGITGYGEADSSPAVVEAIVDAPVSHDKSAGLRSVVRGRDPFDVEVLWNEMFDRSYFYGRKGAAITAMSGIDMALWDIMGKATDKPVHKLIGGAHRESVRAYASTLFPADPTDTKTMRERARAAQTDDFTAVKFGWGGFGDAYETDRALLAAAREELGDSFDIMVDAGMIWGRDVKRAVKDGTRLDEEFDLYWIEEPIYADNVDGYRRIAEAVPTRVVGGEEEYTSYGFRDFIERGQIDGVQPDVARSGGITHMCKIATQAQAVGIPLYPHGYSTDLIIAANLHLCAAHENAPLLEYCVEDSPLRWELVEEEFPVDDDGHVAVPDDPGLGVTIDWDTVERYRTEF